MKYILPFFLLFIIIPARAQYGRNEPSTEFMLGYGAYPTFEFLDRVPIPSQYIDNYHSGGYYVVLKHNVVRRLAFSLTFAFENETGQWGAPGWGTFKRRCFTYVPEVFFTYASPGNDAVRFYCNGGIAYTYVNEIDIHDSAQYFQPGNYQNGVNAEAPHQQMAANQGSINFYVSPIGIRFGRVFAGFVQLGFGYKGIVSGGLSYQIYKNKY